MSIFQKARFSFAVISQGIGAIFLVMAAYYTVMYFTDTENHLRHEYLMGTWLGLLYATGFSLSSALLAVSVKNEISKPAFQALSIPALVLGLGFLVIYLGSLAYDLVSRT